jgi:colicin import membrane protein
MRMISKNSFKVSSSSLPRGGPPGREWKLPLSLTIGIHLAVLAMILISPHLSQRRPTLPEIYTVNLLSAVEAESPPPAAQPPSTPAVARPPSTPAVARPPAPSSPQATAIPAPPPGEVRTMESERIKKEVPSPPPPPPPPKEPPVSERPLRSRTPSDDAKLRDIRRQLAAQEARKAEEAAQREIEKALASIRDLHRDSAPVERAPAPAPAPAPAVAPPAQPPQPAQAGTGPETQRTGTGGTAGGAGVIVEEMLRHYLAQLHSRIQQHWTLPDLQKWDDSLEALMVIKVRKDGMVIDSFFEIRSENYHFNQFVEKAIRDASPLPPFPPGIREEPLEIGLRFRPGELFY